MIIILGLAFVSLIGENHTMKSVSQALLCPRLHCPNCFVEGREVTIIEGGYDVDKELIGLKQCFSNYDELLKESELIVHESGLRWLVTKTLDGYISWVDKYVEQPIGIFSERRAAVHSIYEILSSSWVLE